MASSGETELLQRLRTIAAELAGLDCLDPAWDEIQELARSMSDLVDVKRNERSVLEAALNVSSAVAAFTSEYEPQLFYHELDELKLALESGPARAASAATAGLIREQLGLLGRLMKEHEALRAERGVTRSRDAEIRERLAVIEHELSGLQRRLVSLLTEGALSTESTVPAEPKPACEPTRGIPDSGKPEDVEQQAVDGGEWSVGADASANPSELAGSNTEAEPYFSTTADPGEIPEDHALLSSVTTGAAEALALPEGHEFQEDDPATRLWESVLAGDFPTAYWLSHVCPEQAPPWLLKACAVGKYVQAHGDEASTQFASIVYDHGNLESLLPSTPEAKDRALLLASIAAVRPAVYAPETGAVDWLDWALPLVDSYPFLLPIVQFARTGLPLEAAWLEAGLSGEGQRLKLQKAEHDAEEWRTQQRSSRLLYTGATQVMHSFATASSAHPIARAVDAVASGEREQYGLVVRVLDEQLGTAEAIRTTIDSEYRRLRRGPSSDRIVGPALGQMISRLQDLGAVFKAWVDAVRQPAEQQTGWRETQIARFREGFRNTWVQFSDAPPPSPFTDPIARQLGGVLWAEVKSLSGEWLAAPESKMSRAERETNWLHALQQPLFHLSPAPFSVQHPVPEKLDEAQVGQILQALRTGRTIKDAVTLQVEHLDFVAAHAAVESAVLPESGLIELVESRQAEASADFRDRIEKLRSQLELSTVLHVLNDAERAEFEGKLLSLESREAREPRYGALLSETEEIWSQLEQLRHARIESLSQRIPELDERIEAAEGQTKELARHYREESLKALRSDDLALADEYLSLVERALQHGYESDEAAASGDYDLERFKTTVDKLNKRLEEAGDRKIRDSLAAAKGLPGLLDQTQIPGARKVEIAAALDAFRFLKQGAHSAEGRDHQKLVADITTYLGFRPPEVTRLSKAAGYWHYKVKTTDAGASPLPHFGSYRNGVYDLLVVWERPNAERLGQIIQELQLTSRAPIVLFMGRITPKQREEWGAYCLRHELTVLLVDEGLLYFLAGVRENRLSSCVAYSLPWGYANPYAPVVGGLVAPEMFVGRKSIIRELADPMGSAIIYGGRQLGKSAILRAIERDYHRPERREYVFFDDIRNLGSTQDTSDIWHQIKDWAARHKLMDAKVLDQSQNITSHFVEYFEKHPDARVHVLLDEADHFLAEDARHNFREVQALKALMDATERRFKVVFSGLHSVQRYCLLPNHPFAHLNPISIGPLDPADARTLVESPMRMLGMSVQKDAVYRILAITNYQPALIQHVCMELVRNRRSTKPPYAVTTKMVEDLSRQQSVRQFISERFTWTVGLDPRYEGLVYGMILVQADDRDGFRRTFDARQALELAKAWWPKGFSDVTPEEASSLLRELVGLGVLVRLENGLFRLRNANVVRMLGALSEIEERMLQLSEKDPPSNADVRQFRARLPLDRFAWSPFTLDQESSLLRQQSGVGLVFMTQAAGGGHVDDTVHRLANSVPGSKVVRLPADCLSLATFRTFVDKLLTGTDSGRHFILLSGSHLLNFAEGAYKALTGMTAYLRSRRSRERALQCIVTFDAAETFRWFDRGGAWARDEDLSGWVIAGAPWGADMIRQALNEYGMLSNESAVNAVAGSTGGWPFLLEELFRRLPEGPLDSLDPRPVCTQVERDTSKGGLLVAPFLSAIGLGELPLGRTICEMVTELRPGGFDEILFDLIPGAEDQDQVDQHLNVMRRLSLLGVSGGEVVCNSIVRRALGV